jgi:hypothetical protein
VESSRKSARPLNKLDDGIGCPIVLVTGAGERAQGGALRVMSSTCPTKRQRACINVEHVSDKAAESMHDRGVILLPIAREPT